MLIEHISHGNYDDETTASSTFASYIRKYTEDKLNHLIMKTKSYYCFAEYKIAK